MFLSLSTLFENGALQNVCEIYMKSNNFIVFLDAPGSLCNKQEGCIFICSETVTLATVTVVQRGKLNNMKQMLDTMPPQAWRAYAT